MKSNSVLTATAALMVFCSMASAAAEPKKKRTTTAVTRAAQTGSSERKLQATRKMLLERMKASRDYLSDSLPGYEEKLAKQTADYEMKKKQYDENLISQLELENSARALTNTRLETDRVRQWIAEDNVALSLAEEAAEEELVQLPRLAIGGYDETATLIFFNGAAHWSLADSAKIAKFYRARFGQQLPVSAMGQSPTHDRMGFDHREAVDVAVSPDSPEGRGLMAYLRKIGIPFIAFRGKVRNMSTGAHIHIGRPSPRLLEVRHRSSHPAESEQNTAGG